MVTEGILQEFKGRMKIFHSSEDGNLERILAASFDAIRQSCGTFGFDNEMGKELVFERARYAYNDALELFSDNFLTQLMNFTISLMKGEENEDTASEQEAG